jgi:D-lactate dehydrogenase (quinone)
MPADSDFIAELKRIVNARQVLTNAQATEPYRTGFRCGRGAALAVVRPRSLIELWRVLEACVAADKVIIMQAANTGLTGGSTPFGDDYDRDVIIVNTMHIRRLYVIDGGRQVICLPGTTLYQLEAALGRLGREPHSVIGSSCIGASVIGGVCNNSGGALIKRGPAYTQMALYAQLDRTGQLHLVNHLGVRLGETPEHILGRLDRGEFAEADIDHDTRLWGSDREYTRHVRDIDCDSAVRFNANPRRLFEASGCGGKLLVFAVRLDTFAKEDETRTFYIGTQDPAELAELRRHVLSRFEHLPVAGEYMHRDLFDVADLYGKDSYLSIRYLGTKRLPWLFRSKRAFDALVKRMHLPSSMSSDRLMQALGRMAPDHLPRRLRLWRQRFEHHLLLKMSRPGISEAARHLGSVFPSRNGDCFECTAEESESAFRHRFVAAGAALRYQSLNAAEVGDIIALDIALKRNDRDWFEVLPADLREQIHLALYYGHFFCHVFHQDYVLRKGADSLAIKQRLCDLFDRRGVEYPAEHNVGHLYAAKPALAEFYRNLDPCNQFNPGIGQTSKLAYWANAATDDSVLLDQSRRRHALAIKAR